MRPARSPNDRRRLHRFLLAPAPTAGAAVFGWLVLLGGLGLAQPLDGAATVSPPRAEAPRTGEPRHVAPAPIWVPTPIRIDRNREERPRIRQPNEELAPIRGRAGPPGPDGGFAVGAVRVRHPALILPDRRRLCTAESGARWSCGLRAHTTLSALVTGRDVSCRPVSETANADGVREIVDCRAGGRSLVEELVGEGWAEVDRGRADPAVARLADRARETKRGLSAVEPPP